MRLFLVRHGQTASNVARLLDTAFPGADLDETGRAQAASLVPRIGERGIEAIYASDLVRTQQTAADLAAHLGHEVRVLGGLREIQAGEDEMSELWQRYVGAIIAWSQGDLDACVPGGENAHAFMARYDEAILRIAETGHERAMAVSHGAALRTWVSARVSGLGGQMSEHRLGNTTVITVEGDPDDGWRFVDWEEPDEWVNPLASSIRLG